MTRGLSVNCPYFVANWLIFHFKKSEVKFNNIRYVHTN